MVEVEMLSRVSVSALIQHMETVNNQNTLIPTIEGRVDCQRQFFGVKKEIDPLLKCLVRARFSVSDRV